MDRFIDIRYVLYDDNGRDLKSNMDRFIASDVRDKTLTDTFKIQYG